MFDSTNMAQNVSIVVGKCLSGKFTSVTQSLEFSFTSGMLPVISTYAFIDMGFAENWAGDL